MIVEIHKVVWTLEELEQYVDGLVEGSEMLTTSELMLAQAVDMLKAQSAT